MELKVSIAHKMKNLRAQVGLDQATVARALDIPRSAIAHLEAGDREMSVTEFDMLCRLYRVSPNEILGWNRIKPKEPTHDRRE